MARSRACRSLCKPGRITTHILPSLLCEVCIKESVTQRRVFTGIEEFLAITQDDEYKRAFPWLKNTLSSQTSEHTHPELSQIILVAGMMYFRLSSPLRWTALLLFFFSSGSQAFGTITEGAAIALIRNNLNLYSRLQDTKNFAALNQVFTQDASPVGLAGPSEFPNNLTGIEEFLKADLKNFTTLHYSDTQYVQLDPSGHTATALSYGQAVYFGENAAVTGQICTFYETFTDEFVLQSGIWLSKNKTLHVYVCGPRYPSPLFNPLRRVRCHCDCVVEHC